MYCTYNHVGKEADHVFHYKLFVVKSIRLFLPCSCPLIRAGVMLIIGTFFPLVAVGNHSDYILFYMAFPSIMVGKIPGYTFHVLFSNFF